MRIRAMIVTSGLAISLLLFGVTPAVAASGSIESLGSGARTRFDDSPDRYIVCDLLKDGYRAVGWIRVLQPDNTWKRYAKVEASGVGTCTPQPTDVLREAAPLEVTACVQNGRAGTPFNCRSVVLEGS